MIFKKSAMEVNTSVVIKPIEIRKEATEGKWGPQDEWYVQIDGEDATTYTGYKDGQQDWHGDTLTAAMENDLEIIPVVNKIDLPSAEPEKVALQIEDDLGLDGDLIQNCSAKTGIGVPDIFRSHC